ncbi:MAG: phosphatase PAP2 family protein [Streptomyces sp.]|nr:phosphatase PAP2 family protein [Streptomyces sp.]
MHEAAVLGGLWLLYTLGRALAGRRTGHASGHASQVWSVERDLHLPDEGRVQRAVLHWSWLVHAANDYYKFEHFLGLVVVTVWLLLWRPSRYLWFRRVLVLTTAIGLVLHLTYPLAPPRLRPDFGVVDTGVRYGESVYGGNPRNHGLLNQYAAMPSLHVAWAVLFALTVVLVSRSRWRWLAVGYPAVTTYVVVVTGNHYWLDGIVGIAALCLALLMSTGRSLELARLRTRG